MAERIEQYLDEVGAQVRWKRVRPALTQELRTHLEEQAEAYRAEGLPAAEAEAEAVRQMGDAEQIGLALDAVHRPKRQTAILSLAGICILLGAIFRILSQDSPKLFPLAALVLVGSIPGAFLLKHVDARAVKVLFGVVVAALGAEMFSREYSKKRLRSSKIVLAIIGVTAGVLCGLFGVGALLAAYVSRVTEDGGSFKANISAVFIVDNTFRIVLYSALGLLTFDTLKTALLLLPFALAGLFLGMKCSSRMNESLVKKITSILLVLSGISLILKNL